VDAQIKLAPTATGCCIRVEGSGTLRQSPAADDVASRTLGGDATASVVFDLSDCEYLDSTFLGVLIDLYRRFGRATPPRYFIAGPEATRKRVLGPMRLERLIPMLDAAPATVGNWVAIPDRNLTKKELIRHVMEAHRSLAQVETPMREVFARIASQMEQELGE
jgi:anti-anti-sigma factor